MKLAAVGWLLIECWLSHTPGEKSGAESRWLAKTTGVDEGVLRRAAHVFLFLVLAILVLGNLVEPKTRISTTSVN